jgi:predicted small secreted protein
MKKTNFLYAAFVVSAVAVVLLGCGKQEGPAEHAGKSIDNAAESVGEHVQNAGEAIQNAAKSDNK